MKKTYSNWPKRLIILACCGFAIVLGYLNKDLLLEKIKLNQLVKRDQSQDNIFYSNVGSTPASQATAEQDSSNVLKKYTVEILTTRKKSKAESIIKKLAEHDIDSFYIPLQNGAEVIYRVRVGLFQSKQKAEKVAKVITKKSGLKTSIKIFL